MCRDMPLEPQLYQMPASINEVLNATQHLSSYKVHDLSQMLNYRDDSPINLDQAEVLIEEFRGFNPDIPAFVPCGISLGFLSTHKLQVTSDLNVDAKMFIPPFDRYRKYRSLAQIEELKEFKDKEAKIAAIGRGNELIKAEVLEKLQQAKTQLESETKEIDTHPCPPEGSTSEAKEEKLSKRKRKIAAKLERKESVPLITETIDSSYHKHNDAKNKPENTRQKVKPFQYKNVDYRKFYDESDKGHKQSKKFKKRKQF